MASSATSPGRTARTPAGVSAPDRLRPSGLAQYTKGSAVTQRPVILVRLRQGIVGERKRVIHSVPAPDPGQPAPGVLVTLCGERLSSQEIDVIPPDIIGMSCNQCVFSESVKPYGAHALREAEQ